jgi:hypothetical protein
VYDCTPGENAVASQVLAGAKFNHPLALKPRTGPGRGVFGWVLFVALGAMLYVLLDRPSPHPLTDRIRALPADAIIALFVLGLGVVLIAISASLMAAARRVQASRWKGQMRYEFSDRGVVCSRPGRREWCAWEFFTTFDEISILFVLRTSPKFGLVFPKRLFADEAEIARFRALLRRSLTVPAIPQSLGFPVEPPAP